MLGLEILPEIRRSEIPSPLSSLCHIATGIIVGDGNPTQVIRGLGFQPKSMFCYAQVTGASQGSAFKTDQDGLNSWVFGGGGMTHRYETGWIVSLDADGFTVGTSLNGLGTSYTYIVWG